ncbi:ArsA family ATPase [Kibdelosporangium phytohabitans]|uniref:Arsenic-transporting ATPase n=1 Tax=Kibdelosporangium phytohabitans TaxID=860235 RepID=A0A0N9I0U7_9PSEU|nr:ArsA family ATPase [Kibdelosporangium phytohabitans]ALG07808.1 arsenic-transporting ATPase [Kibdelosporangium phytohabitans]MBE1471269.1 arsenite-transporting ATPase [Kibdelosporangium phytohabitans]
MRILLFTGKGGVGKTTLAAATAVRLAASGRETLVVSTDPAHSLADAFGTRLTGEPSLVDTRLHASHVDSRGLVDSAWGELRQQLRTVLAGAGVDELDAEELTVVPGLDELLALTEVARLARTGQWDAVVVDCGPTAETLRLLALPDAIATYLQRAFPARSVRGMVAGVGRQGWVDSIGRLAEHLAELRDMLADPQVTGVRLVLTPERLVVAESKRTLAALALRDIRVDGMIANRLVPKAGLRRGPAATWLRTRRGEQDAVLAELKASTPIGLHVVEHRAAEPVGLEALGSLADELYGRADPLGSNASRPPSLLQIRPEGTGYVLRVAIPLSEESDVNLARVGDDLAITVDGMRRLVPLPAVLRRYEVADASVDGDGLLLQFAGAAL